MDSALFDRWWRGEAIAGVTFAQGSAVEVITGQHAGSGGAVISLEELSPERVYMIELGSGEAIDIPQSSLRTVA